MTTSAKRPTTGVVIAAAGQGQRMGSTQPKQFLTLNGESVLLQTCRRFAALSEINTIMVVVPADHQTTVTARFQTVNQQPWFSKLHFTPGGATRQDSVKAGLDALPENIDLVLVHDGARPLVDSPLIRRCIQAAADKGAAIAAIEVKDTLKRVNEQGQIIETVSRDQLWQAQTPQAAQRALLCQCLTRAAAEGFVGTDESSVLEHYGIQPQVVIGAEQNLKITRPGDLNLAERLTATGNLMRIGHGFDAHRFAPGRPLILGGVTIPHTQGLLGHSDADVLTHALIDALIGALGQGDIGGFFPDNDPAFKDISSLILLERVWEKVQQQQYQLGNADLTLICQHPRLAPHIPAMREQLARGCHVEPSRLNIKATTTEKMGYTGRGEGIAAQAVVLLQPVAPETHLGDSHHAR